MQTSSLKDIEKAFERVKNFVHHTPILSSDRLNKALGHKLYFKGEHLQKMGAFKARGAFNAVSLLKEQNLLQKKLITYSSGNHSQAMAWVAKQFSIPIDIYMTSSTSKAKVQSTKDCGAHVIFKNTRPEIEKAYLEAESEGNLISCNNEYVIQGQGTACYEALKELQNENISAVFAPLGGGSLLSGSIIAARGLNPNIKIFGSEPVIANDGVRSLREGTVFKWPDSPPTIADGVRSLSITKAAWPYIKTIDKIFEIEEEEIIYWTQWVSHLLKAHIEPTSALGMGAAFRWLVNQKTQQSVLIILSGGNFDSTTAQKIWEKEWLTLHPSKNEPEEFLNQFKN